MSLELLYRRAQKDCYHRIDLVKAIDLEYATHYIRKVVYIPENPNKFNFGSQDTAEYGPNMCTSGPWLARKWTLPGLRSKILVYPSSFSFSWPFFLSTLIDHEGHHAREYSQNPKIIRTEQIEDCFERAVREAQTEIRAYQNQLKHSGERGLSPEEILMIEGKVSQFEQDIIIQRAVAKEF